MDRHKIAILVGSLRKESLNRRMARNLESLAPEHLRMQIVEIRDLPLYDQDLDGAPPPPWVTFRDRIRRADAALFVTPEYNRSIPSPLKPVANTRSWSSMTARSTTPPIALRRGVVHTPTLR